MTHLFGNSAGRVGDRLSTAVNSAMVTTYWEIGEQIFKACGENDRAEYGKRLLVGKFFDRDCRWDYF